MAEAWEDALRSTEDPLRDIFSRPYNAPEWYPFLTYRAWLTRKRVNMYGQVIPQIVVVRRNLRDLKRGNTRTWRGLTVQDRRQQKGRRRADA